MKSVMPDDPVLAIAIIAMFVMVLLSAIIGLYCSTNGWDGWYAERERTVWDDVSDETRWMSE